MFDITIKNILSNIWPMVLIITVILVSLRISYFIKTKEKFRLYSEIFKLGFIIYIIGLFYVVTFQDVSWSTSNFIPFKEILRYDLFSEMFFKNVIGNMIMFIPYGFFISYFLRIDKKRYVFILSLITSITIEVTQLIIGRVFDVDDILLNLLGAFVGFYIYRFLMRVKDKLPKFLTNEIFYNIVVIIMVGMICHYIYYILGGFNVWSK